MITEEYLREDLIFTRDIPHAYLRIGSNIEKLMGGGVKIDFAISDEKKKKKATNLEIETAVPVTDPNDIKLDPATEQKVKELQDKCHNDLIGICSRLANQRHCTIGNVMNMQTIKEMSIKLPTTEEEMKSLPHVTDANFAKIGKELLDTTCMYAAEKLGSYFRRHFVFNSQGALELLGFQGYLVPRVVRNIFDFVRHSSTNHARTEKAIVFNDENNVKANSLIGLRLCPLIYNF